MKEKYGCYEFEIFHELIPVRGSPGKTVDGFTYKIFQERDYLGYENDIESDEWFETAQEARFAAIGHITLLENGEG